MSSTEQKSRTSGATAPEASPPRLSVAQLEARVLHELDNLLSAVAACGERLASSPDVTAAARLDLLALAGRVAHAIIDGRRRGVSLRRWIDVNPTLTHLEAAVRLLLSPAIDVVTDLDPRAGSVYLAPGELDLMMLNLVLDARSRLRGAGHLAIRSTAGSDRGSVAIAIVDHPREANSARIASQFGLATVGLITRDAEGGVELLPGRPGEACEVRILLPARPSDAS